MPAHAIESAAVRKKNVTSAIEDVARQLGNTKAVCRRCYIHPAVLETYLDGDRLGVLDARAASRLAGSRRHLSREETAVLALLRRCMRRGPRARRAAKAPAPAPTRKAS